MNAKMDNLITVLDAGSSKSCVLVAELIDGVLRYRGHGIEVSQRNAARRDLGSRAGGEGNQCGGADSGAESRRRRLRRR